MIRTAVRFALVAIVACRSGFGPRRCAEPDGYRLEDYRAPTPATLRGARVDRPRMRQKQIWRSHSASFVDVMPRPPRPRNLPEGTLWHDKPRANIPGSIWLPDTGYGELAPSMADYFAEGWRRRPTATAPGWWCSIVWRIAGCRGTPPSARSRSAIRMSPGIAKEPTAGSPPACRCKMPRPSRVRANRAMVRRDVKMSSGCSLCRRVGVHRGLDRTAQIKQPLLDQDGHVAHIGCRFAPVLENARLPRQLVGERVVLRLIGVGLSCMSRSFWVSSRISSAIAFCLREKRSMPSITSSRCALSLE